MLASQKVQGYHDGRRQGRFDRARGINRVQFTTATSGGYARAYRIGYKRGYRQGIN